MQGGNKSAVAAEAEARFLIDCLQRGWLIAKPIQDGLPFDYLFQRNSEEPWRRVQVKQAYPDKGRLSVNMRRSKGSTTKPYGDGDFDFLYATWDGHKRWLIPWYAIKGKRSVVCVESRAYFKWRL